MFEVSVEATFCAAHYLRNYRGKCERLHGHNYRVQVTMVGEELDEAGMLVDFTAMKRALREAAEQMDHRHLNEVPPFDVINPSAENLAKWFHDEMRRELAKGMAKVSARVESVKVWETDTSVATYRP